MNKIKQLRHVLTGVFITAALISLASCSKKIIFQNSEVAPAARGSVKVKKDNNNNYAIEVQLYNLAEVKRLPPPNQAYVVWIETDHQAVKNIGQINSSESGMGKKLKASLETVTSFKPVKVFVTAEDDGNVQHPGMHLVLTTDSF